MNRMTSFGSDNRLVIPLFFQSLALDNLFLASLLVKKVEKKRGSMEKLLDEKKYCDVIFKLDSGKEYSAHRAVLVVSDVECFKTLFNSSFCESASVSNSPPIVIHDVSEKSFEYCLKYAYTRKCMIASDDDGKRDDEDIHHILKAASFFGCMPLAKELWENTDYVGRNRLLFIECALAFGNEFEPLFTGMNFTLSQILNHFVVDNTIKRLRIHAVARLVTISAIDSAYVFTYLDKPGVVKNGEKDLLIALLGKLDLVREFKRHYAAVTSRVLYECSKRGLVDPIQILRLLAYNAPHVIQQFPLIVGYKVESLRYKAGEAYDGKFLFCIKTSGDLKQGFKEEIVSDIDPATFVPHSTISYIFVEE